MKAPGYQPLLTSDQTGQFERDGFLLLKSFYNLESDIVPIQRAIYEIIGILIDRHGVAVDRKPFRSDVFDSGYQELIAHDRRLGAQVYDAVKQIPAFVRLVACERHDRLLMQLRNSDLPGVAGGGYGIRIDNPFEERFRANWHQDYPSQFRSIDGLVFWSPLVPVTPDLGPLQVAVASHRDGLAPLTSKDPDHPEKTGAYGLRLQGEAERVARYRVIEPILDPGDLLIIDYLNLHASGFNRSTRSRWSMQMRYFNFRDPQGQRMAWAGSFAAGRSIREFHPELMVD